MKALPSAQGKAPRSRSALASARSLARLFQALVAAAAPAAILGVAGFACGAYGPPRCEAQSYVSPYHVPCPSAAEEQTATSAPAESAGAGDAQGTKMAVAGDAQVPADKPEKQAEVASSCKERCSAIEEGRNIESSCAGPGCCTLVESPDGECSLQCFQTVSQACGRRPSGLVRARRSGRAPGEGVVGAYLAGMAELEAASVTAFEVLAGELAAHGAPARLISAARKSTQDERRHTRSVSALAKRYGGALRSPRVRPRRPRSLRAMALENAVEGCVREAFGALVATYQAEHAQDARVRRAMRGIAADETSHAALAYRVGIWLEERLDAADARSVRAAMRRAGRALLREVSAPVHPALARELGLPPPSAAIAMARGLLNALEQEAQQGRQYTC